MRLKTYSAGSLAGALALVRHDLGSDAVILNTRTDKRGGFLGLGAKTVVQITATDGESVRARKRRTPRIHRTPLAQSRRQPARQASPQTAGDLIRRTYAAAQADMAKRSATEAFPQSLFQVPPAPPPQPVNHHQTPVPSAPPHGGLADELRAVKSMVQQVLRDQRRPRVAANLGQGLGGHIADVSDKLFGYYLNLLKQEVCQELVEQIIQQVQSDLEPRQLQDPPAVRRAVLAAICGWIPTDEHAGRFEPTDDRRPRTVALIGPTGVGKTTTIAKLAANLKLKQKKSVGLITLDTYRIAAVEQLRTYANIIGVPLHVVTSPAELVAAQQRCAACDAVLIDSAGRSQRDNPRLEQLKEFFDAARPHEVHLVLSSTCSQAVLLDAVERFSVIRADRLIFTKLDEAVTFGVLLNVARKVNKRLSYITTGQEVPHQIEPGHPERLANLVLGEGIGTR